MIAPAPSPCRPRNPINETMFQDSDDAADPARKIRVPVISTGLRPNRSDSLP